jgi:hypothetical protein
LISVEGSGLYLADEQKPDGGVDVGVLTPHSRLFGQLFGVCFNEYPYVPNITEIPPNHDEPIPVRTREGMVMILGSVLLCGTEDDGPLEDIISYAHVPLAEDSLVVAKAEIFG